MFVFKPSCCCCFWSQWKLTEQWLLSLHYVYASELLSTTCHEVRSVWAAVLYWMKIWLFRGFLLKFHFKQLSLLKVVFLFPFPYISSQRKDSQHSPRPSTSPVVYCEEQDAGRFSAQERRDNFGLCQAKKPPKIWMVKGFTTRRCASSYLMCC